MQFELYTQVLLWGFSMAIILGAVANKTNFCTMGAVSDWINIGDKNRLRAWVLAMAIAILGIGILEYLGMVDMSLTANNDTANPPYRTTTFVWLRNLVGGLMFGIGMTLASGCGNKTLVRLGEGNMKSIIVLFLMAIAASIMLFTSFDYFAFLQWMMPLSIDFTNYDIPGQDLGSVIAGVAGLEASPVNLLIPALIVGLAMLFWVFKAADFRTNRELLFAGLIVGALVVIIWYITAGPTGQALLEELDFMDERPYAAGAQSFSFIAPAAHVGQYAYQGFAPTYLSFGVVVVIGVILGSFLYTLLFSKLRVEWFTSWNDFIRHVIGAILMGFGGILGMGCTIGQGITGVATLALGSFVTVIAIVAGSAGTMKYQYYRMMKEID
jgi:uncharacterized membrane protein YedE/YeeE